MALAALWLPDGEEISLAGEDILPSAFNPLLVASALASEVSPADPMDLAIHNAASKLLPSDGNTNRKDWQLAGHFGISPALLAMTNVWQDGHSDGGVLIATKGAPEMIARLCRLPDSSSRAMMAAVENMANKGIRVLGVATARASTAAQASDLLKIKFSLSGLIGLADPLRTSVPDAIRICHEAGIRVVMITGDHAATAGAIAASAGIGSPHILTGTDMAELDDAALSDKLKKANIFARIMPEQKLRLVQALKAQGQIVAMTGDGVNDAPSLKAAHVGIAMGGRGTDVAREASSLVLLDDEFTAIVSAVQLGRRIYDNIRKAMEFIFAAHVPIAGLALLPLAFGLPMLIGPIHIALLEMVIDPACALVFEAEAEDDDIMRRPPRDPEARLFSLPMVFWSVFQGLLAAAFLAIGIAIATQMDMPIKELRALAFCALIAILLALILVNRSNKASLRSVFDIRNRALLLLLGGVAAAMTIIYWVEPVRDILGFARVSSTEIAGLIGFGLFVLLMLELLKTLANRFAVTQHQDT
jgi:P-type Ca2+ transporter type 2C